VRRERESESCSNAAQEGGSSHICNTVGMGYANDEGSCSGLRLGMRVAVRSDAMSEVDSKARLNYSVSRIEGGGWVCVEREYAL